jgi:hypothetical protein
VGLANKRREPWDPTMPAGSADFELMKIYDDILGEEEVQLFEDVVPVEEISIENITIQNAWMELLFDFDAATLETDVAEVDRVGMLETLDPQVDDWDLRTFDSFFFRKHIYIYLSVTVNFPCPGMPFEKSVPPTLKFMSYIFYRILQNFTSNECSILYILSHIES